MKKSISIVSAAVFSASILAGGTALAQSATVSNPGLPIANYDVKSIGPVLNELGVAWEAQKGDDGQTYIAANVADSVNFLLAPTACRAQGADCVGLNMVAIFEGRANPQTVQAFNFRYAFASAGLDPSGAAYLSRYEIADYGVPRGNLATSIQVFANQVNMFRSELATARQTVSLEGYADDLSASMLNRVGVTEMTGVEAHAATAVENHQVGFERAATQLKKLISDTAAPRNKIDNINVK